MTKVMKLYNVNFYITSRKRKTERGFDAYKISIILDKHKSVSWTSYLSERERMTQQALLDEFKNFINLVIYCKYYQLNIEDKKVLKVICRKVNFYYDVFTNVSPEDLLNEYNLKYN